MAVNLHATHFRFGVDELAESTHGWHAAEDANPAQGVIASGVVFLLRFTVQETGGTAAANVDVQFQFSINGAAFANLTTTSVGPRAVAAAALTDAGNCTKRLTGTGTFESSGAGQTEDGLSGGNANDIAASGNSETECGIVIDAADVVAGDTITFRLTSPDFTITNDVVPTIVVESTLQTLSAADAVAPQATEVASAPASRSDVADASRVGVTEAADAALVWLSAADIAVLGLAEAASLFAQLDVGELEVAGLSEAASAALLAAAADTLAISAGDDVAAPVPALSDTESVRIAISEAADRLFATVDPADSLALALGDTLGALAVTLTADESARLAAGESIVLDVRAESGDVVAVAVSLAAAVAIAADAVDAIAVVVGTNGASADEPPGAGSGTRHVVRLSWPRQNEQSGGPA